MGTYAPVRPTKYCQSCGGVIDATAIVCPNCGVIQSTNLPATISEKRILPAFLLCFFLGVFGAHRFYAGKVGTGVLQLVTLGGLGIWALVDFIMIIVGNFTDKDGEKITQWV
jgi:TM2 domain-containing membrane protein YozV